MNYRSTCGIAKRIRKIPRCRSKSSLWRCQPRHASSQSPEQVNPLGGFYEALLSDPLPSIKTIIDNPNPLTNPNLSEPEREEAVAKAKAVFGESRVPDAAKRKAEVESKSLFIAGIKVPPRPIEPDNCCMSGCVNCVWDQYRDELEVYSAASKKADAIIRKDHDTAATSSNKDDDGGGSSSSRMSSVQPPSDDDMFKGVPIGIREFMRQEKKLQEKRARNGAKGS